MSFPQSSDVPTGVPDLEIDKCEQALERDPNNDNMIEDCITLLLEEGDCDRLEDIFEKLEIKGRNHNTIMSIFQKCICKSTKDAQTLLKKGRAQEARDKLEPIIKYGTEDIKALTIYNQSLRQLGEEHGIITATYQDLISRQPENPTTLAAYASYLSKNSNLEDYQKARTYYEKSLKIKFHIETMNNYIRHLVKIGESANSIETSIQKICSRYQNQAKNNQVLIWRNFVEALSSSGQDQEVIRICQNFLENRLDENDLLILPSYGNLLGLYAKSLAKIGKHKEACSLFEQSLEIKFDNYILFIYALSLEHLGKYIDAINTLKTIKLEQLSKHHENVIFITLGRLYFYLNLEEQGNDYFQKAMDNSEDREKTLLATARSILASNPYSSQAIDKLKQITIDSDNYSQAYDIFMLHSSAEEYFNQIGTYAKNQGIQNVKHLYSGICHKVINRIILLQAKIAEIKDINPHQNGVLQKIINKVNETLNAIINLNSDKNKTIEQIPNDSHKQIIKTIQKTSRDIVDTVVNELALIQSFIHNFIEEESLPIKFKNDLINLCRSINLAQINITYFLDIENNIKPQKDPFIIDEIFAEWSQINHIKNANITVNIKNHGSTIHSDKEKIQSIINELIENSLKNNEKMRNLVIKITCKDDINPEGIRGKKIPGEKKYLLIEVSDNGKGIPKNKKDWIFLATKTTAKRGEGSGLGLYITKEMVNRMGGHIRLLPQNTGATFQVYIPYHE